MVKKTLACFMSSWLACSMALVEVVRAETQTEQQSRLGAKVRHEIARLRARKNTRLTVVLQDHTKLTGSLTEASEESFVLTDSNIGTTKTISYRDVAKVRGTGLSKGARIALWAGVGIGSVVLVLIVAPLLDNS